MLGMFPTIDVLENNLVLLERGGCESKFSLLEPFGKFKSSPAVVDS